MHSLAKNPAFQQIHNRLEAEQKARIESGQINARRGANYELPVVVHVIHNNGRENISDVRIERGIQLLNEAFATSGEYAGTGGSDIGITLPTCNKSVANSPWMIKVDLGSGTMASWFTSP